MTGCGELSVLAILLLCRCSTIQAAVPVWTSASTASVSENAGAGTFIITLSATDADLADTLTYSLVAVSTEFEVVSQDLRVKAGSTLNFEVTSTYSLAVRVNDGTTDVDMTMTISVLDVNEPPSLTVTSGDASVVEGQFGALVAVSGLVASDPDAADATLTFSLTGADSSDFSVNSAGVITTTVELDRETQDTYGPLILTATDSASNTATVTLTISVTDVNDVTPTCNPPAYYPTVAENTATGNTIATLTCTDTDDGVNGAISASIFSGNGGGEFSMSGLHILTTGTPTDYETTTSYTLVVHIVDTPTSPAVPLTGTATVFVMVTSVNDNNPAWGTWTPNAISMSLLEDASAGTSLFTAAAVDNDDGTGGDITYTISAVDNIPAAATDKFFCDSQSGKVSLQQTLDRDAGVTSYTITVTATDGTTPITKDFTVTLADVNDNMPTFSQSFHAVSMSETATTVGASVTQFTASDVDESPTFTYSISSVTPGSVAAKFQISTDTLELASALDLDTGDPDLIMILVEVTDSATAPVHTATCTVSLTITSANDFTPAFGATVPPSPISVPESTALETSVAQVTATDSDFGPDGVIEFSITGGNTNDAFRIIESTGEIRVYHTLDYETLTTYSLEITARDQGSNSATITVTFSVTDVNDNLPVCSPASVAVNMAENEAVTYAVTTATCPDGDGDSVTYTITSGNTGSAFSIDAGTGAITLANLVDYDSATQSYTLQVEASDGTNTDTMIVIVNLTPVNEHIPSFSSNPAVTVSESESAGYTVITYTADDDDYGTQGITQYAITAVTESGLGKFSIDGNGEIRLTTALDHENPASHQYELTVTATDGGSQVGTGTVTVNVGDINDNSPVCPAFTVSFLETQALGFTGVNLACLDAEDAGVLTYLTPDGAPYFSFLSSFLILDTALDYETATSHTMTMTVEDRGLLTSTYTVVINVENVNEGLPTFSAGSYSATVAESVTIGSSVVDVSATDVDGSNSFGNPQHSIISGNVGNAFLIDAASGTVSTAAALDAEVATQHLLTIKAVESGDTTRSATVTLTVTVTDDNDNVPSCTFSTFVRSVAEPSAASTTILTLTCTDDDASDTLAYSVFSGDTAVFEMSTNELQLKTAVDFDPAAAIRSYALTIRVSDGINYVDVVGNVNIDPVNESPPSFSMTTYSVTHNEDLSVQGTVQQVSASDADSSDTADGQVTYGFVSAQTQFSINPQNGEILLVAALDRETAASHTLLVTASDATNTVTATVSLTVGDLNDNAPVFSLATYTASISESDPALTTVVTVTATDGDDTTTNLNGVVTFLTTIGNDPSGHFAIDGATGVITTTAQLDASTNPSYALIITATDRNGNAGALTSTAQVIVTVTSENQYDPVFTPSATYTANPSESAAVGTQLVQVVATDQDGDTVTFSMSDHASFSLDSDGWISVKAPLDYETPPVTFSFDVVATDNGSPTRSATAVVTITVGDANDNTALCTTNVVHVQKREDAAPATVTALSCTDSDSGSNAALLYSVVSVNGVVGSGAFAVDSAGVVSVSALDYETDPSLTVIIDVVDQGTPPLSTTVSVIVTVSDVNEAAPVFAGTPLTANVAEDEAVGATVLTVAASDADGSDTITFSLDDTSHLQVDPNSGVVTLGTPFDYETATTYTVNVVAVDSNTVDSLRTTSAVLTVTVTDANDNDPAFNPAAYLASVDENEAVGITVTTVTATDADALPLGGTVSYALDSGNTNNVFRVHASTGSVIVDDNTFLDYETTTGFTLIVSANDADGRTATCAVTIQVNHLNEHSPVFTPGSSISTLAEDKPTNQPAFVTITATDADTGGNDGTLTYSFHATSGGAGLFSIDPSTGGVSLVGGLDRETAAQHTLIISATDGGVNPSALSATYVLTIDVTDVNDVIPFCPSITYADSISEDAAVLDSVAVIVGCTDGDVDAINSGLTYAITGGNTGGEFQVDPNTGLVTVQTAILDRETTSQYTLTLDVADTATSVKLTTTVTLSVTVTDANDQIPAFSMPAGYSFSVAEDSPQFYSVGAVAATDGDVGANAAILFSLTASTPSAGKFSLDPLSGDITVISALDYETEASYELTVTATDQATPFNSVTVTVTVAVTDVDDQSPVCTPIAYTATKAENAPFPALTGVALTCSDTDSASLTYSLTDPVFQVDNAGVVSFHAALDFETAESHTLLVGVSDGVNADTTAVVMIAVTPVNEFTPTFAATPPYAVNLPENSALGTTIMDVDASDQDNGGSSLSFSMTAGGAGLFRINADTGFIILIGPLDRETAATHSLTLEVTDGGFTATTGIVVTVDDVNDNDPQCTSDLYFVDVAEDAADVANLLVCTDADSSTPTLQYTLAAGNTGSAFTMDVNTGKLTVASALDYETLDTYVLTVEVDDQGSRTTTVTVNVNVTPVNEMTPAFPVGGYANTDVSETAAVGDVVITVSADDTDTGLLQGTVRYSVVSGDPAGHFQIDRTSGVISVAKPLDRETTPSYTLVVRASDDVPGSAGEKTADVNVPITITDVNDNFPQFTPTSYTTTIQETATTGGTILTVTVADDDIGTNGQITVTILSGNTGNAFSIAANNVDIILSNPLDYETTTSYSLELQAVDQGSPALTSNALVSIVVLPVNEDPPILSDVTATAVIPEDTPVGTLVYTATATDNDQGSDHGSITFSILSGDTTPPSYTIDANTGELRVFSRLDYDTAPQSYSLVVQAVNSDGQADTLTLSVTLTDVNDHTPQFSSNSFSTNLNENVANGHLVYTVTATDLDSGANGQVSYTITGGSGQSLFGIGSTTGAVTTTGTIDYELDTVLYVTITATDGGSPALSADVYLRITILDLNDNTPVLVPANYAVSWAENIAVGTSVAAISGTDADSSAGNNNVFYYSLVSAEFEVDAITGIIKTKVNLDREANPSGFVLYVVATDQGLTPAQNTATATVTVNLADVNDNIPVITNVPDVTLSEDAAQSTVVFQITATDADINDNSRLNYVITTGNTGTAFSIVSTTGLVQVASALDRETTPTYILGIQVTDNGVPIRTATVSATVTISDVNDNDPAFTGTPYAFSVDENSVLGVVAGTVAATDIDTALNANLVYSLQTFWEGDNTHFVIDGAGGQIKTGVTTLDRETRDTYYIQCRVNDQGTPQRYADVNVTITITDVNDNPPVFSANDYAANVAENTAVSTPVLSVTATDADIGANAVITFSIDTGTAAGLQADTYFQVNPTTGEITVKASVDFEVIQSFTFDVIATDGGATPLTDVTTITITITDVNDNNPAFTAATVFINTEVAYGGQCTNSLAQLVCTDVDSGNNGVTACYIEATHSYAYLFAVDGPTCEVTTKAIAAANSLYVVDVQCRDAGSPVNVAGTPSVVRVDTFIPDNHVIKFELGIDQATFELQQTNFMSSITAIVRATYPTAILRLWCIKDREGTNGLVDVHVYAVQTDSSDSQANIAVDKDFIAYGSLRSFFTSDADGAPNSAITGTAWDYYEIERVSPYSEDNTPWIETAEGIAIVTVACVLGAICLVLFIYLCVRCIRKRKRPVTPVRAQLTARNEEDGLPIRNNPPVVTSVAPKKASPAAAPKKASPAAAPKKASPAAAPKKASPAPAPAAAPAEPAFTDKGGVGLHTAAIAATAFRGYQHKKEQQADAERKRSVASPSGVEVESSPNSYPVKNREFDGRALDPVTGQVYEYSTKTHKRRWLDSPPGYNF